jgi:hypothetical protein
VGRLLKHKQSENHFSGEAPLVFDRQRFEANTMYDGALQREILGLFLDQLQQIKVRLEEGPISAEDSRFLGHTLKGAAAAVGGLEFEDIGSNWEKLAIKEQDLQAMLMAAEASFKRAIAIYKI